MHPWTSKPFVFWLYARMCASNETSVLTLMEQLAEVAKVREMLPAPRTWTQTKLHLVITRMLNIRRDALLDLMSKGAVATGWIAFNDTPQN